MEGGAAQQQQLKEVEVTGTVMCQENSSTRAFRMQVRRAQGEEQERYVLTHVRYSALAALSQQLAQKWPEESKELPAFPGKTLLAPSEEVWRERVTALNRWFSQVTGRSHMARFGPLLELLAPRADSERLSAGEWAAGEKQEEEWQFVSIRNGAVNIGYTAQGDKEHPLVLFVHGFPDSLRTWRNILPKVEEEGFWAVAMAQRGYYPSSIPAGDDPAEIYNTAQLGLDILEVIEALGKTEAVLVGHDWGASAVWSAAARSEVEPKWKGFVSKVVALAIPPPKALAFNASLLLKARHFIYFNTSFLDVVGGTRKNNYAYLDDLVRRWSPTWKIPADELDAIKSDFEKPGRLEAAIGYYKALRTKEPRVAELREVDYHMPIMFFGGEMESGGGFVDTFKQTAVQSKGYCEVVLVRQCGHFIHRETEAAFLFKFLPFLKQEKFADSKQVKVKFVQQRPGV